MNDCLVTYIENDVFDSIINENIKQRFQNISTTRKKKKKEDEFKHKQIPFGNITILQQGRQKQKGDFIRMKYKNLSIMKKNIT